MFIFILPMLFVCTLDASSQTSAERRQEPGFPASDAYRPHPNAVGFFSGQLSGTGLHYQRWLGRFGFQITGGVLYSPTDDANVLSWSGGYSDEYLWNEPGTSKSYTSFYRTSLYYSVGAEFLFQIVAQDMAKWFSGNLYVFAGINHSGLTRYYYEPMMETYLLEDGTADYYWIENFEANIMFQAGLRYRF